MQYNTSDEKWAESTREREKWKKKARPWHMAWGMAHGMVQQGMVWQSMHHMARAGLQAWHWARARAHARHTVYGAGMVPAWWQLSAERHCTAPACPPHAAALRGATQRSMHRSQGVQWIDDADARVRRFRDGGC